MENGKNEFWDPRILKKCIGKLNNFNYLKYKKYNSVSSLRFNDKNDNLFFSGFQSGEIIVYDLRCFSPLISKVIHPLNPVKTIRANYNSNYILVSDSNFVKYWRLSTGKTKISFKSEININHICSIKNTGIIFFSLNYKNIGIKYFKSLGPLPEWSCALE
jgi:WD40 repeat protein